MNFKIHLTYLCLGAAIMFQGCSQDDMPGRPDAAHGAILFRASLPELQSRADIITTGNLPYFYAAAFDLDGELSAGAIPSLFDNEKVNKSDGDEGTFSSPYCCWPDPTFEAHRIAFYSFYPGEPEVPGAKVVNASTASAVDYRLTSFRVAPDIADQVDFVAAYATGNMADNLFSGVLLPFDHKLSRVEIKACGKHKSCDIEIAGVRIGGVGVEGTFNFKPVAGAGEWSADPARGIVEYIFRDGDKIVACGKNHQIDAANAVSIMGSKRPDGNDNCAMLIPSVYSRWDYAADRPNAANKMYISVLIRVTDATLTAGVNPVERQRYPYRDLSQGADSYNVPVVYMAVDKSSGVVSARVYKKEGGYFTDAACSSPYTLKPTEEIKEFGWAALPVDADWAPGKIYTYTLDYTVGVGLHDPAVTTSGPRAGDPIISDKVGLTYKISDWKVGGGDQFPVPGS